MSSAFLALFPTDGCQPSPVETSGDNPGWINRHKAVLDGKRIVVTGGKIEPGYRDNPDTFVLSLNDMVWHRL